jgi:hypothetical protein
MAQRGDSTHACDDDTVRWVIVRHGLLRKVVQLLQMMQLDMQRAGLQMGLADADVRRLSTVAINAALLQTQ